mgnify:CR=1 FL=1
MLLIVQLSCPGILGNDARAVTLWHRELLLQTPAQPSQPEQPAHQHTWQDHVVTTQTWISNIVVVEDYGELSAVTILIINIGAGLVMSLVFFMGSDYAVDITHKAVYSPC